LDTRAVQCPPEPGLPQLACFHAHDATTPAPAPHATTPAPHAAIRGLPGPHPAARPQPRKPRAPATGPGRTAATGPGTAGRPAPATTQGGCHRDDPAGTHAHGK